MATLTVTVLSVNGRRIRPMVLTVSVSPPTPDFPRKESHPSPTRKD